MFKSYTVVCLVCQNPIESDNIYYTPCSHTFDSNCIKEWLKRSATCPQCRCVVRPKDVRQMYVNTCEDENLQEKINSYQIRVDRMEQTVWELIDIIAEYQSIVKQLENELSILSSFQTSGNQNPVENLSKNSTLKSKSKKLYVAKTRGRVRSQENIETVMALSPPIKTQKLNPRVVQSRKRVQRQEITITPDDLGPIASRTRSRTLK